MIKQLLSKLALGLSFGIGLGVALGGAFIAMDNFKSSGTHQSGHSAASQNFQSQSGISIKGSEVRTGKYNTTFLGTLKNDGKDTWRNLYIVVELFDASGKFVDRCSAIDGSIVSPGQERHFKIPCEGCSDNPQVRYDKYTIKVENGILATM